MLGERWITGKRPPAGEWKDGTFQAKAGETAVDLEFRGSAQPVKPAEVELLLDGEKTGDVQAIMTKFQLKAASEDEQTASDLVELYAQSTGELKTFKVISVKDLSRGAPLPHFRAVAVML